YMRWICRFTTIPRLCHSYSSKIEFKNSSGIILYMTMNYKVRFYSNTPDDTHCWQASLRMVMKYFKPKEEYSWEEMDKITEKIGELWTWPIAGLLYMADKGYLVKVIEAFDYKRFIEEGSKYIYQEFGEEVANAQEKHADIQQGIPLAQKLISKGLWEKRTPVVNDIIAFLEQGYLVICNVNAAELNNKKGYVGHSVVIKGYEDNHFLLNDPGLPPQENRIVDFDIFEKAWAYPDEKAKNINAIKLIED
ncbi:MAG: C39 family peptidase, partial [Candidatus Levyibacteriota bacterium]